MPKLTDTYSRAFDCCDEILTSMGRFPTIELVRERIGVNSPANIKRAINDWTLQFAERHVEKLQHPKLPVVLLDAAEALWKLAVVQAEKSYQEQEHSWRRQVTDLQAILLESRHKQAELQQSLTGTQIETERAEQKFIRLQHKLESIKLENQALTEQLVTLGTELESTRQAMTAAEQQSIQRLNQDQIWFARRLAEEKDYIALQWKEKVQRLQQQVATLDESETILRMACSSLRQEQRRLQQVCVAANANHRFQKPTITARKVRKSKD